MKNDRPLPLCVDLDGTLIRTDLLLESFLLLIKRNPAYVLMVFVWLLGGKAHLKRQIAARVSLPAASLPYTQELVTWLKSEHETGREIWLCTASDELLARPVADHLGLFTGVLASTGDRNLAGHRKGEELVTRFGERGFDYCGNAKVDLHVWSRSHGAVVVNAGTALAEQAGRLGVPVRHFPASGAGWRLMAKALRLHQWAKNFLVLVPVAAAHRLGDPSAVGAAMLAFFAFSLCASSVYLLNDLLDLEADRQHHSKCHRPFASGRLSIMFGLVAAPVLLAAAAGLAWLLPLKFVGVLAAYYVVTLAYSFWLKRVVLVDVLVLASLYTVRIVAGAAAAAIALSFWLLMFSIFVFLSLAMVKRYAELHAMKKAGKLKAQGRGYQVDDLSLLQSMGTSSGYASMLVLALYLNSPDVSLMYQRPKLVWLLVPLMLYWISRIWMKTHRGQMHDDPLVFAMKDRISVVVGALTIAVLTAAAWRGF